MVLNLRFPHNARNFLASSEKYSLFKWLLRNYYLTAHLNHGNRLRWMVSFTLRLRYPRRQNPSLVKRNTNPELTSQLMKMYGGNGSIDQTTHSQHRDTSLYPRGNISRYPVDTTLCRPQGRSGRDGQSRKILSLMGIKIHPPDVSSVFHNQGSAQHR
jgi:hypothetical protein